MSRRYTISVTLTDAQVQTLEELTKREKALFPDFQMGRGVIPDDEYVLQGAVAGICGESLDRLIRRALAKKKALMNMMEQRRTSHEDRAHSG